ncbi:hypothetical protein BH24ACT5_BH24ACT5_08170 [soil metagenome]
MTAPTVLRAEHAVELAELLEFIHEWLSVNCDRDVLGVSLRQFCFGLFTIDELRSDIGRFAYLLGGDIALVEDT